MRKKIFYESVNFMNGQRIEIGRSTVLTVPDGLLRTSNVKNVFCDGQGVPVIVVTENTVYVQAAYVSRNIHDFLYLTALTGKPVGF